VVIGDGPDLTAVREEAHRLGLTAHATFLGWRHDIDRLLPLLDVLLLPSLYEGLPQTAVQAVTAGVPVVAYAVGGLVELLPPGATVPHGDEAGLARSLTRILKEPGSWPREAIARRAVEWCAPANVAGRILRLWEGNRRGSGRPA
jgi:glycosyltransferase involved in cell wall biosynthesis